MKKAIVPLFITLSLLLSAGFMYGSALYKYSVKPSFVEKQVERDLSLSDVKKTNIVPLPDVDYSIVYSTRIWTQTKGLIIKTIVDTAMVTWVAKKQDGTDLKVKAFPEKINPGNLKIY